MFKAYKGVIAALLIVAGLFYYGVFIEPNRIVVKKVTIRDDSLFRAWQHIKILQLSDLHITKIGRREKEVLTQVSRLKPDLICITGDLAQWGDSNNEAMKFLNSLDARYGVFVVLGDADMSIGRGRCIFCHVNGDIHKLRNHPVFLRNSLIRLKLNGGKSLELLGISPDLHKEHFVDFWKGIRKAIPGKIPLLVLSHFSSLWDLVPSDDHLLWLSGDTHGGQVALPRFLWPLVFKGKDYRHLMGLFSSGQGKWLYVSQGLGTTLDFPVRIGVPPEITLFSFVPSIKKGPGT